MAVGKGVFEIAALEAEQSSVNTDENVAEVRIGPDTYTLWREPTSAQFAMMNVRYSRGGQSRYAGMDKFFGALVLTPEEAVAEGRVDSEGVAYADREKEGDRFVGMDFIWDLYEQGAIDDEDLVNLMRTALEIHTGFPTASSSDSSAGRKKSGTPSTAASRRNTSTRSR